MHECCSGPPWTPPHPTLQPAVSCTVIQLLRRRQPMAGVPSPKFWGWGQTAELHLPSPLIGVATFQNMPKLSLLLMAERSSDVFLWPPVVGPAISGYQKI
eukprot:363074-Chlamydomonas_euryale.AAC.19